MAISNTTQKGNIGQAAVTLQALKRGYITSVPNEGAPYDLVIDRKGVLSRVQVKYVTPYKGAVTVKFDATSSKTCTQKYTQADIDAIVAYNAETEETYWIPSSLSTQDTISLRVEAPKNNQMTGIVWAKDFKDW